jgi:mono/diheme cytochrome c family protein
VSTRGRIAIAVVFTLTAVAAAGCGAVGRVTANDGSAVVGKTLFKANCGSCHTLANAGTTGTIGPDLDDAFGPDKAQGFHQQTIRDIVRGQIAYADSNPDTGTPQAPNPGMPQNILRGKQADDVAIYVALCAAAPKCNVNSKPPF